MDGWTNQKHPTNGCSSQLVIDAGDNASLRKRKRKVRWVIALAGVLLAEALDSPWKGLLTTASKRDGTRVLGNVTTSDELTPFPLVRGQYIYRTSLPSFSTSFLHHPFFTVHFHSILHPFRQQLRCPFIYSTSSIILHGCAVVTPACFFIHFIHTVHTYTLFFQPIFSD
ncbi:hypothetical protein BKA64DRAFT_220663 [Cadophora sp. MPI-SDFR-AT-0126]|nr:hypothetical protein BKA64DRAFT_220663 [Leotiomycetes sp. MPI-SDFR-AT-0126]